jgi:hypothetical protein
MNPELKKMLKSMGGGTIATWIFIFTSFILDNFLNAKVSNAIALLTGAICNFYMQHFAFLDSTSAKISQHGKKFFISEFAILGSSQIGVNLLLNNKKKVKKFLEKFLKIKTIEEYYNTFIRLFITGSVFIFVSFPIRKHWVFSK